MSENKSKEQPQRQEDGTVLSAGNIVRQPANDGRMWECRCARCGSEMDYEECYNCDEGYSSHDCGEDSCCCLHPEDNVICDICEGKGGWWVCMATQKHCEANPMQEREHIKRHTQEWYPIHEN